MFPVISDVLIKRVVQQVHGHHDVAILRRKVKSTWMAYIDLTSILSLFCNKFNEFDNTGVRKLESIYHYV